MRLAVIVASLGRPQEVADLLHSLAAQTLAPSRVILSLEKIEDAPSTRSENVEVVLGTRGLCAQRNRGLEAVFGDVDVVVFYDDDFIASRYALQGIDDLFRANPSVVGATGQVLADGITTGGLTRETAVEIVRAHDASAPPEQPFIVDVNSAYGCNMAFRLSTLGDDLRFDERMPLYAWLEDVDFAGRLRKRGRMVSTNAFAGVHRGVTRGRMPGHRLGFSQVVNPVYLVRKGSMTRSHAAWLMFRNLLANHTKAMAPEPHIDRRGRVMGNWRGLAHLLNGRADPGAVLDL